MISIRRLFTGIAIAIACAAPATAQTFGPLVGSKFGTGTGAVFVYLHGDVSRGGPATYHDPYVREIVLDNADATGIALLRPGYSDGFLKTSPGDNHGRKDQYSQVNNDMVADTLRSIRAGWPDAKLVVLGHSGGAAQLGVVIAQNPALVDTAILLSCPCHLKNWMNSHPSWNPNWTRSLSPSDFVDQLTETTKIIAITGADDTNTRPKLAKDYVAAATKRGMTAEFHIVPGGNHHGNAALREAFYAIAKQELAL